MAQNRPTRKALTVTSLVMLCIAAVSSLRSLPFGAEYGAGVLGYYAIAALTFFIPAALVSAEMATGWPEDGGIYIWVREAFGQRWAFTTIWIQWIYNVIWLPTILSLVAATIAYGFDPSLAENKSYMLAMVLIIFWFATFANFYGMKIAAWIIDAAAVIGTILPTIIIIVLGGFWIYSGKPLQVDFTWQALIPDFSHFDQLGLLVALLYGLVGIELCGMHANSVQNPHRNYPKAIFLSAIAILGILVLGSLAIAIVVPVKQLSIVTGLLDAFKLFLTAFHLQWAMPIIILCIVAGAIAGIFAWTLGPAKGLMIAARDGNLPPVLAQVNDRDMPVMMLLLQAGVFTCLSTLFLLMPTVKSSFWILTDMAAILSLLVYAFMFMSAIRLRYKRPTKKRAFTVPGGKLGIWTVGLLGLLTSLGGIVVGLVPPKQIAVGNLWTYESILLGGIFIALVTPWLILNLRHRTG